MKVRAKLSKTNSILFFSVIKGSKTSFSFTHYKIRATQEIAHKKMNLSHM